MLLLIEVGRMLEGRMRTELSIMLGDKLEGAVMKTGLSIKV
jgi:hypothetical protein